MVTAAINAVYVLDPSQPKELGLTREGAPELDGYRFPLSRKISIEIEMGLDPSDGGNYSLLIGMFIDGKEVQYVTDWIGNTDPNRVRVYSLEVPNSPVKLMQRGKVHTVQFKIGCRRTAFSIPAAELPPRQYNLAESEVYYYKIAKAPE